MKNNYEVIFLREFTREIIINISKEHRIKRKIEIEKLKQRFLKPQNQEQVYKNIAKSPVFYNEEEQEIQEEKPTRKLVLRRIPSLRKSIIYRKYSPSTPPINKVIPKKSIISSFETIVKPEPTQKPEGFNLGKIEQLLQDATIQLIECPGPGKNLIVKRFDKTNTTKIILTQEEITNIIQDFSNQAKIPLVGGILKAAVGNLIISAITSEFVGSRFIITKINPY